MKINVTAKHIRKGECGDPEKCAVAQAIFDTFEPIVAALKKYLVVSVNSYVANVSVFDEPDGFKRGASPVIIRSFNLPKKITHFIAMFDRNKKSVKPISFELAE